MEKEADFLRKDIVSTVLKEGMVVGTKLSSCNVWVQNIIYKVKKRSVTIALLTDYLQNVIMFGQPFQLNIPLKIQNTYSKAKYRKSILTSLLQLQ